MMASNIRYQGVRLVIGFRQQVLAESAALLQPKAIDQVHSIAFGRLTKRPVQFAAGTSPLPPRLVKLP